MAVTPRRTALPARSWAIWTVHRLGLVFILTTELMALAVTAGALRDSPITVTAVSRFAVLLASSICYAECADRVERVKRYLGSDRVWANLTSVWAVCAVLVLPMGLACLLVAAVYGHVLLMGHRYKSVRPHRIVFTAAAMVLATAASSTVRAITDPHGVYTGVASGLSALAAIVAFHAVDLVVLVCGMFLAVRPPTARSVLPSPDSIGFETITQLLGLVTALLIVDTPWLMPAALPLVAMVHRASLVKELRVAATVDTKTSLLNPAAWRERATEALSDIGSRNGTAAVLVVDLDHFKRINDEYGHLLGDQVLREVAICIRSETRTHDVTGRFGGDELVVLMHDAGAVEDAIEMAGRLRAGVRRLELPDSIQLTVSIGVAYSSTACAEELEPMLKAADAALYESKSRGRDQVQAKVMGSLTRHRPYSAERRTS